MHREVTLDDFVPRALDRAFVALNFWLFHLQGQAGGAKPTGR
jgi:hypothetical protein